MISFTLETDGRLPTGQTLKDAIEQIDARDRQCAGLLHDQLRAPDAFRRRARRRASAGSSGCAGCAPMRRGAATPSSTRPPISTPAIRSSSASYYAGLRRSLPHLTVLGGCCGTDHRHVEQICFACVEAKAA